MTENGYVPTPEPVADLAAASTFAVDRPGHFDGDRRGRILLPGLGTGRLFDAVQRYCTSGEGWSPCRSFDYPAPECVGVETDPKRLEEFHASHPNAEIDVHHADFLLDPPDGQFDWVLSNPPFVRYRALESETRDQYREQFRTAVDQFDLFVPFFEQALRVLKPGGWLTFFFPISALCAPMFESLRWEIRSQFVEPIWYLPPETFDATVETVLISVKKEQHAPGHSLWLEALREWDVRDILEGIGIDDIDAAVERYYDEHTITERIVKHENHRDRKNRDDGGRQSGLEQFASGGEV
ncbi:Eco57I restriction-modification methylase domain-containing protein [Natronorubrum sp. FCH18a]|uniref:Eco57I restriction-modification methylase domain-containing protein n=1 Tax=Natronorubrum sp. FCH18a TaxID=3447018 RepID=UPI003F512447